MSLDNGNKKMQQKNLVNVIESGEVDKTTYSIPIYIILMIVWGAACYVLGAITVSSFASKL
jgi:hypothetical protein